MRQELTLAARRIWWSYHRTGTRNRCGNRCASFPASRLASMPWLIGAKPAGWTGGHPRDRGRQVTLSHGGPLRERAGFVPVHPDHRWQGDERPDQALCQPRGPGSALGRRSAENPPVRARRVLLRGISTCLRRNPEDTIMVPADSWRHHANDHYPQRNTRRRLRPPEVVGRGKQEKREQRGDCLP